MTEKLRVAFIAGTLGQGGAEKQLVYAARALHEAGVNVQVYALTCGEFHEAALREAGIPVIWVGRHKTPVMRLLTILTAMRSFRPHVIQSFHFFANLYAGLAGRWRRTVGIGALRSDGLFEMKTNGRMGRLLLRTPKSLIANSNLAKSNVTQWGLTPDRVIVLPNVIDLAVFDASETLERSFVRKTSDIYILAVGRMIPAKCFDRFIRAFAQARREAPHLHGILVGDGPEMLALKQIAESCGLDSDAFMFLGKRDDVPALMRQADMMALTSDREGFPNVILEAMAARLPVITTPAGDAGVVVKEGMTGFVVNFNDEDGLAQRMTQLAQSAALRQQLGEAGRLEVEQKYGFDRLASRLLAIYQSIMQMQQRDDLLQLLPILPLNPSNESDVLI